MRLVIACSWFFVQVAARCFCIPVSKIHLSETSTNTVPNSTPTAASASTDLNGMAVKVRIYYAFVGQSGVEIFSSLARILKIETDYKSQ